MYLISYNKYVYFVNCDNIIIIFILKRLINMIYYKIEFIVRNSIRFKSINFIEYHIKIESRRYITII